jgi:hypothetical protein
MKGKRSARTVKMVKSMPCPTFERSLHCHYSFYLVECDGDLLFVVGATGRIVKGQPVVTRGNLG